MIAIIYYGLGNLSSILNMHKRLGIDAVITADFEVLEKASKLILPGVKAFLVFNVLNCLCRINCLRGYLFIV